MGQRGNLIDRLTSGTLLCIVGIDGAGKTTVSKQVVERLRERGIDAQYVYGKYRPTLLLPVMKLSQWLFLGDQDIDEDYESHTEQKQKTTSDHRLLARAYLWLFLIDYLLQLFLTITLPLARGRTVVSDRYVFDTVAVELANDFGYSVEELTSILERLAPLYATPDHVVMLDVPPEVSVERKDDIPDVQFVADRREHFLALQDYLNAPLVDGTKPLAEVSDATLTECLKALRLNSDA